MVSIETLFIAASSISTLFSLSVLVTVFTFPVMRKRGFIQIVIFISASEFVASVTSTFGFPPESSPLCPVQSFFTIFSYKCSWMWTTILCHQLYSVITDGRYGLSTIQMHALCWGIPLLSTLLPLTTTEFGRDDDGEAPLAWCFLEGKKTPELLWVGFSFYLVFIGCLFTMIFYMFSIFWQFRGIDIKSQHPDVHATLDALKLYPLGMMVTWVPNMVFSVAANIGLPHSTSRNFINTFNTVTILATQDGTITALIFFLKSREARLRWWSFLTGTPLEQEQDVGDFDIDEGYDSMNDSTGGGSIISDKRLLVTAVLGGTTIKRVPTFGSSRLESTDRSTSNNSEDNADTGGWSKFPKKVFTKTSHSSFNSDFKTDMED